MNYKNHTYMSREIILKTFDVNNISLYVYAHVSVKYKTKLK